MEEEIKKYQVVDYMFGLAYIGEVEDGEVRLYYSGDASHTFPVEDVLKKGTFYKYCK